MLNVLQNLLKCRSKLLFFKSSFCFCYLNPNLLCCIYQTDKYIKPEILRGKRQVWRECDIVDCIPISCSPWQMLEMYWVYQTLCWTMGGIFPRRHCWPQTWLKARQLWTCQRADYLPGGEKAGLQKGRQPSVFTEITGDKSQFYISVIQSELSPTTDSGKGREEFSTVRQINGRRQTCRFTHMLPPVWTGILYHCGDFYPRNWSITLRLNNPSCLDIYGNTVY